jgi:hypothetical protein
MAHPKLQLSRLLDWITLRIECEDTSPTDDQIAGFLGLDAVEIARSMLADLADRGDITIKGTGPTREIALGRQHRTIETVVPTPSVTKPAKALLSEEECAARIQAIMSLGKTKTVSPAAELEAPASGEGERPDDAIVQREAPSVPLAAPPSFEPKRLPTAPTRIVTPPKPVEYQVNLKLSAERYEELRRMAKGGHVGPIAKQIFDAAMDGGPVSASAPIPLFRIPAEVTRAAIKNDMPVLDFAAMLMMRGLGSFEQDAAREIAA